MAKSLGYVNGSISGIHYISQVQVYGQLKHSNVWLIFWIETHRTHIGMKRLIWFFSRLISNLTLDKENILHLYVLVD